MGADDGAKYGANTKPHKETGIDVVQHDHKKGSLTRLALPKALVGVTVSKLRT